MSMLSTQALTPGMIDQLSAEYDQMMNPMLQSTGDPAMDARRQAMFKQNAAMQQNAIPAAPLRINVGTTPIPQNEMIPPVMDTMTMPQTNAMLTKQPENLMEAVAAQIAAPKGQQPLGQFVSANWQDLLTQGVRGLEENALRENLPADTYLKLKTVENEKTLAEQNQFLNNLKLQADLDYQRQSIELKREELAMQRQQALMGGSGSDWMADARILMEQDPSLTLQDAYAMSRSGLPRGVTYNPVTGRVEEISGFSDVTSAIGAKEKGAETAATETAKIDIEKKQAAPKIIAEADLMIKTIDETLNHPGLSAAVGAPNPLKGSLGSYLDPVSGQYVVRAPVGSDAKSFESYLNQLGGQGFLQAYESLRGAAGITNIEGGKAQVARGRLNPTQGEKDFKQALMDMREWAVSNKEKALKIVGGSAPVAPTTPTAPSIDPSLMDFMTPEERALFQ